MGTGEEYMDTYKHPKVTGCAGGSVPAGASGASVRVGKKGVRQLAAWEWERDVEAGAPTVLPSKGQPRPKPHTHPALCI